MTSDTIRIAILDTETTGLYPSRDRIIEIAILLVEADRASGRMLTRLDSYQSLEDPGFPMAWGAVAIHGITDQMVKGHRIDRGRVRELLGQAELLVAHNSGFDKGFVAQVVPEVLAMDWACSCRGIPWRKLHPWLPNSKLQGLAEAFQVERGTAHRALGDVETTLNVLCVPGLPDGRAFLAHLIEKRR